MPVYVKSIEKICQERAADDARYYYDDFKNALEESVRTSDDPSIRQDLARLERWLVSYRIFAEKYHQDNYVKWNDMFEDEEHIKRFGFSYEKPRAPFIGTFDDF